MVISKNFFKVTLVLIIFVTVSILLSSISSETLINYVGSDNVFFLMFVLGAIGGLTTFTGIPYHFILMSFAAGGINPILLGLCTATGVMLGDSTMFFLSRKVKTSFSAKTINSIDALAKKLNRYPYLITPTLVAYGALSPISNDFIVASLSIMGYSFKRIMIPLAIGNIIFNISIAYLGLYAYDAAINFF